MASIEIITPDGSHEYTLRSDHMTIGRLGTSDIVLPFSHISRRHAEVRWANGKWWIADLQSTNGLHISGQRVHEAPLQPGAIVALSPHVSLRLLPSAPTSTPPPRPISVPSAPIEQPIAPPPPPLLSAFGPRSPYAEDETPYYPHMRPAPPVSQPRPSQPGTPAARARHTPVPDRRTDALPPYLAEPRPTPADPAIAARDLERQVRKRRESSGALTTTLHICQTCGQLTAPDAVYCQNCHHSIATECPNCRLSLLPVQESCPRCQTANPGAVRRGRNAGQ